MLWSSASVAGKWGLMSAEPLTLFTYRFLAAGLILIVIGSTTSTNRKLPHGREWIEVILFGFFNTAIYLGIFIIALQNVTAGITALALTLNPLFISLFSSVWMKRRIRFNEWISILLGIIGVAVATWPLLNGHAATGWGLFLLFLSMVSYSIGAVYYASVSWKLPRTVINGWQTLVGGIILLPLALFGEGGKTVWDTRLIFSLAWLVIPVSIGAVQLWLFLLKEDAVKASLWLFLCPVFGLTYATLLLDEPFTVYTIAGGLIVMISLYIGQRMSKIG